MAMYSGYQDAGNSIDDGEMTDEDAAALRRQLATRGGPPPPPTAAAGPQYLGGSNSFDETTGDYRDPNAPVYNKQAAPAVAAAAPSALVADALTTQPAPSALVADALTTQPAASVTPAGAPGPDPFAAMGGGVLVNGGWVPANHPLAQTAGATIGNGTASSNPTAPASVKQTVTKTYLDLATQPKVPQRTDAEIRLPAQAYSANVERATRSGIADAAERNGPFATGATAGEARMLRERGGAASGQFEAELMTRELQSRREEILTSLAALQGSLTEEQRQALQRELAQLEQQVQYAQLGQNQSQFADNLGFQVADREQYWSDQATRRMMEAGA